MRKRKTKTDNATTATTTTAAIAATIVVATPAPPPLFCRRRHSAVSRVLARGNQRNCEVSFRRVRIFS
eukprot:12811360-Alexandrium_andersonii.AAC.1